MKTSKCPLCDSTPLETQPDQKRRMATWVVCPRCGTYGIDERLLFMAPPEFGEVRHLLSGIVREFTDETEQAFPEIITLEDFASLAHSRGAPTTPPEQLQRLLVNIGKQTKFLGEWTTPETLDVWAARAFVPSPGHVSELLDVLKEKGWILERAGEGRYTFSMTITGLEEYYNITKRVGTGDQCFIALWYEPEVLKICREIILPAVEKCGFKPYMVVTDPQDDRIDNKIIAEIQRSRFMIADLTGVRGGVYYEAGYAQGLGKLVMWCCHDTWRTNAAVTVPPDSTAAPDGKIECTLKPWKELVHFDVRQFPFNFWSTPEQWRELTVAWIESRRHLF